MKPDQQERAEEGAEPWWRRERQDGLLEVLPLWTGRVCCFCSCKRAGSSIWVKTEFKTRGEENNAFSVKQYLSIWLWAVLYWLQKLLFLSERILRQSDLDLPIYLAEVRTTMGLITRIHEEMLIVTYLENIEFPWLTNILPTWICGQICASHIYLHMQSAPILLHAYAAVMLIISVCDFRQNGLRQWWPSFPFSYLPPKN